MIKSKCHRRGGGNYSSASSYGEYVNGSQSDQFNRTFSEGTQSNILVGAQGQNASQVGTPSPQQLSLIQSAGRRRRYSKHHGRRRRGGVWGTIINQAAVPFTILAMQKNYKKSGGTKKRRNNNRNKRTRHNRRR